MLNQANHGRLATSHRLTVAVGVSLLLHCLLLWRFGILSSVTSTAPANTLQVSLLAPTATSQAISEPQATSPAEEVSETSPPPQPEPLDKASRPIGQRSTQPRPEALRVPGVVEVPTAHERPPPEVPIGAVKPVEPVAPPSEAAGSARSSAANTREAPPANTPSSSPSMAPAGPPQLVAIEFDILSGVDRRLVGSGQHRYVAESGGSYGISITQQLKSELPGQGEAWQLEVSGRVTRQGLSPELFEVRGNLPERLMTLKDVSEKPLAAPGKTRRGRMPDGILDRQSLLYQFMRLPPAEGGGTLWLTDGTRNGLYTYRVAESEFLFIASLGVMRTSKVVLSTSGSAEMIELWLLPDLHYLPAKMRHVDERGVITEQVVSSISFP